GGARMFEAVRQLEICLGARPIRSAVFTALHRIYHEAFLEPRLKSQSLVAVPLDPNFPQEKDVPSELEIKGPGTPPQALMGRPACCKGRVRRAVVTYPTVAPPSVRREVETLVRELRFPDVVTDYDEAVAAALFYLHREFGGSLDLGPEVFKARSRRDKNKWFQNVLVLDIGGGSTDLALLQLTLEEVDPFQPG